MEISMLTLPFAFTLAVNHDKMTCYLTLFSHAHEGYVKTIT